MIKKNNIIIGSIILIMLLIVFIMIKMNLNSIIPNDYYAKISNNSGEKIYNTYLYLEDKTDATYIQTISVNESYETNNSKEKTIKKGKLKYPQDILVLSDKKGALNSIIINKDISETKLHREYKKGNKITNEELIELIAIK